MIGKESLDTKINQDVKENNLSEITSTRLNLTETMAFWDDEFSRDIPKMSFEDLCNEMLWRFEDDFDFDDIEIDDDLRATLDKFEPETWDKINDKEKHEVVNELVEKLSDLQGLPETPEVEFLDDREDTCGFYSERGNYIGINENYINDGRSIANTIAHEVRHGYQHYRAECKETPQDEIYKFNFDHYIAPEYDANGKCVNSMDYYYQYVEAEARAFADKISPEVTV